MPDTYILKFGGSSLSTNSSINQAVKIVGQRRQTAQPVVVVSAIGGITDQLVGLSKHQPDQQRQSAADIIEQLHNRHLQITRELVGAESTGIQKKLDSLFEHLRRDFFDTGFRENRFYAWRDRILSYGERASAEIFAATLTHHQIDAQALEAHHFIKTDSHFGSANVLAEETRELAQKALRYRTDVSVVTGFIGSDRNQQITTLGRSGSDYTASLLADALEAKQLEIWTDVNGILTADPDIVPGAEPISHLSYEDISLLAENGAKVIHPKTIRPIQNHDITVRILNSFNPEHPGTKISRNYRTNGNFKSVTVTGPFVAFHVPDAEAGALSQFLGDRFGKLNQTESFGQYRTSQFEPARFLLDASDFEVIQKDLEKWAKERFIELNTTGGLYRVKKFSNTIGNGMLSHVLKLFETNGIHPLHVERHSQDKHASFLLPEKEARTAAKLINAYLTDSRKKVDVFVAGVGAVGGTLLQQIRSLNHEQINLRILGYCNSKTVNWQQPSTDESRKQETDWTNIIDRLEDLRETTTIFVDATGSEQVARLYPQLMKRGFHIATPSKLANTFEQSYFDELKQISAEHQSQFRYDTTVGAGLPIISTINSLLSSGDTIRKITGVVSGTMTYLFNQLEQGVPFSEAIIEAREKGYAEPDPRDDLSGEDVARKFLTLARVIGLNLERNNLKVQSLIPAELSSLKRSTFLNRLSEVDQQWQNKLKKAQKEEKTLRYTGTLEHGSVDIGIEAVPQDSPVGQLSGTTNLIEIYTDRYDENPIVIQGPGAGREVTAAGLLNDILEIAKSI